MGCHWQPPEFVPIYNKTHFGGKPVPKTADVGHRSAWPNRKDMLVETDNQAPELNYRHLTVVGMEQVN